MWWWLAACSGPATDVDGPSTVDSSDPLALTVELDVPEPDAPLAWHLHAEASADVTLSASWTDGEHTVDVAWDTSAGVHEHTLLGFRPGRSYDVTVRAHGPDDASAEVTRAIVTDALPSHFPDATVIVPSPADVEPGHTLVSMRVPTPIGASDTEVAAVYDEEGHVVWWRALDQLAQDVREVDGGLLVLMGSAEPRIVRYGWDGSEEIWYALGDADAPGVSVASLQGGNFHHDVVWDGGRYVALGRYPEAVSDWPRSYTDAGDRGPRTVASDVVIEFEPDGTVLRETRIADLIPIDRIGYDSLETTVEGWADWAHSNAVLADGDQIIVSMRHQDAIVAFDRASGDVNWILGHPDNWPAELQGALLSPIGAVQWPWHTHAPMLGEDAPDGERRLAVFDNGNHQAAPFTGVDPVTDPLLLRSRVVAFGVDEDAGTVRQLWSFDESTVAGGPLFCEAVGDADWLPGGNVLSTWGYLDRLPSGATNTSAGLGQRSFRLVEFDPDTLADVWHLYLSTSASSNAAGWTAYRADRIESLYGRVTD